MTEDFKKLAALVELGDGPGVLACTAQLLEAGVSPEQILWDGVMPGMQEVGRKFEVQIYFIPEMLRAARAVKQVTELLRGAVPSRKSRHHLRAVLGTVQGDLHDIGKNLVAIAMTGLGIEVLDLGVDVSPAQFVEVVEQDSSIAIVAISALLTATLPAMEETVAALRRSAAGARIKVFVGGAPVTQRLSQLYGADYYTESAFDAATLARRVLDEMEENGR